MKTFFKLFTLFAVTLTFLMVLDYSFLGAQESRDHGPVTVNLQNDPNEGPVAQPESGPAPGENRPVIVMTETEYLAGEVDPSSTVSHEFLVKNEGTGDLVISKVVPGCGCTVTSFTSFIPAGAVGKVTLSVDIYAEWAGHDVKKSAVVMSNDPVNPDIRVTIRTRVRETKAG
ncbi:MAG: DUF1573 domain-containing protein [Deltaproteobacteria bacterium]|jgi:hypothetical protein|nr:DUF1573 domain-containing protein [Deltaproteobacteria bacterium]